jgi:hypothetical protein
VRVRQPGQGAAGDPDDLGGGRSGCGRVSADGQDASVRAGGDLGVAACEEAPGARQRTEPRTAVRSAAAQSATA